MALDIIKCPLCGENMTVVELKGHYGARILVDQCPSCGGIWFDELEHLRAHPDEAERIEILDEKILKNPKPRPDQALYCPRDHTPLRVFSDPKFPRDLTLEHCPECFGFWFNCGEFKKYQQNRKAKTAEEKREKLDPKLESQIDSLLRSESSGGYNTLGKIGAFLSTPVSHDGVPLVNPNDWRSRPAGQVSGIAMQVLTILLRRLIGL